MTQDETCKITKVMTVHSDFNGLPIQYLFISLKTKNKISKSPVALEEKSGDYHGY